MNAMEDRILAQLDGELTPAEERELFAEIEANPEFKALYDDYRRQEVGLQVYYGAQAKRIEKSPLPDLRREATAIVQTIPAPAARYRTTLRLLAAAAAVALIAGGGGFIWERLDRGGFGEVVSTAGTAQLVYGGGGGMSALAPADRIPREAKRIKTTARSTVSFEVADGGGLVELNADSSIALAGPRRARTLDLERGEVLLGAGEHSSLVRTADLQVRPLSGKVSVVRGLRGSEVAVVSGEAEVLAEGRRQLLRAGQAYSTVGSEPLPLDQRLAWSDRGTKELAAAGWTPAPEPAPHGGASSMASTTTVTLPAVVTTNYYMPTATEVIIEVPSIAALLNPHGIDSPAELVQVDAILAQLAAADPDGELSAALEAAGGDVRAFLNDPGTQAVLSSLTGSFSLSLSQHGPIAAVGLDGSQAMAAEVAIRERLLPALGSATLLPDGPRVTAQRGVALAGIGGDAWTESLTALSQGTITGFSTSDFYRELRDTTRGSQFTMGVDLASMIERARKGDPRGYRTIERLGLDNARSAIVASSFGDQARNQAVRISFDGERHGVAGWLREPGAMGGLRYFSPDAYFIGALKIERPAAMLSQVYEWVRADNPQMPDPQQDEVSALIDRLAATLGGEVAFGADNPIAPIPNAKVAFEVVDPVGFHEGMVDLFDLAWAGHEEAEPLTVTTDSHRGHLIVELQLPGMPVAISYAIIEDFVVFSPGKNFSRATIDLVEDRRSIDQEAAFTQALPASSGSHASAIMYQRAGDIEAAKALAGVFNKAVSSSGETLDFGKLMDIDFNRSANDGVVVYAVAEAERIDVFVEGVKTGDYRMAGVLPIVYDLVAAP